MDNTKTVTKDLFQATLTECKRCGLHYEDTHKTCPECEKIAEIDPQSFNSQSNED